MKEVAIIVVAAVGLGFSVAGTVGIMRTPDIRTRIRCSSKTIILGALPTLAALLIGEGLVSTFGGRALLIALLLLVANPASTRALTCAATAARIRPGTAPNQPADRPHPQPDRTPGDDHPTDPGEQR